MSRAIDNQKPRAGNPFMQLLRMQLRQSLILRCR
jgi:hypothetical protein